MARSGGVMEDKWLLYGWVSIVVVAVIFSLAPVII